MTISPNPDGEAGGAGVHSRTPTGGETMRKTLGTIAVVVLLALAGSAAVSAVSHYLAPVTVAGENLPNGN
ncbi:MAG: hypothetical protein QN155_03300 [Armatimonadota bacterium]|nr:hypothetical protein [Armatimonadota bacterium]MDR7403002.1 hypothetical protein [Armatimonadota bacterium]MDR7517552.1 hypothetical protein [Armatimonadota bacterium]MDR7560634.1 hypothetical protein [Armatimonadota bacterium]MDR7587803.1 hypothetical protein [Armatimonadota bacterium]